MPLAIAIKSQAVAAKKAIKWVGWYREWVRELGMELVGSYRSYGRWNCNGNAAAG